MIVAEKISLALVCTAVACSAGAGGPPKSAQEPTAGIDAKAALDARLVSVLAGPQRTDPERARDKYRHPRETLEFFGLRDDMTVVELSAAQGWYTAILAPLLAERGKLSVTSADPNGPPDAESTKNAKQLAERFAKDPGSFGKVSTVVVNWKQGGVSLGPDGSADMVVTFRNLHGWIANGLVDKVYAAAFRVLKHGGILGLTEHRARPGTQPDPKVIGDTGYTPEPYAILLAEKAGFKLAEKSEINANPKDTKDYPEGVWTLPPTFKLGSVDREKYLAIGESDRMTLKFVKP